MELAESRGETKATSVRQPAALHRASLAGVWLVDIVARLVTEGSLDTLGPPVRT
ncbi:MAG: hypothetical protein ACRDSL_22165 [Pseudonocardiaceae bacterium]